MLYELHFTVATQALHTSCSRLKRLVHIHLSSTYPKGVRNFVDSWRAQVFHEVEKWFGFVANKVYNVWDTICNDVQGLLKTVDRVDGRNGGLNNGQCR